MASLLINSKLNEELNNKHYNLTCYYGDRIPFNNSTFDLITSFDTLEHIGDFEKQRCFLKEALRCLKTSGIAVWTFPNRFNLRAGSQTGYQSTVYDIDVTTRSIDQTELQFTENDVDRAASV